MVTSAAFKPYPATRRPLGIAGTVALSMAICMLGVRALDSAGDPLGFTRVVISALAIGAFFAVRRYSVVKGILLALGIEIASGSALFALVDLPFINHLAPHVTRATIMILEHFSP